MKIWFNSMGWFFAKDGIVYGPYKSKEDAMEAILK